MKNRENWKVFKIASIFDVFTGASISQNKFNVGSIPRITAADMNNGIGLFTEKIEDRNFRSFQNFISVSFLGSIFYHNYEASLDMKIHGLKLKDKELNPDLAQFLIACLKNSLPKVSYGNQLSSTDLLTKNILLPVNEYGTPNWAFMEEYVQIKLKQIKATYQFPEPHKITDFRELDEVKWKEYFLTDIFTTIKRGKRLKKSDHISGNIPYISSTKMNNGCDDFIGNQKGVRKFRNCLTIANSGSVGSVFYHDYMFIASDHVTALLNPKLTKMQYLFIAGRMSKIGEKYSFNREITDVRIQREKIKLPVGINGQPDFDFMEQYMKRMENSVIKKVER